jgi:hypothetical protein
MGRYDNFDFELSNDNGGDVLMRMVNEHTGEEVVFLTAPASVFSDDELGPLVTRFVKQIILAYNEDRIEEMIMRSVERNAEEFGEAAAAFLPLSKLVKEGMRIAEENGFGEDSQ